MNVHEHPLYQEDVRKIAEMSFPWEKLRDKSVLISGGTGMIGSLLADVICFKNENDHLNCRIIITGRNRQMAESRFAYCFDKPWFDFVCHDINEPLHLDKDEKIAYVIHLASNTHPRAYATDPIGTITTNLLGTKNLLDLTCEYENARFVFTSSNEVYGENRGDTELFSEDYCGYINCNTMRAGYPESKRCSEALCQAYKAQKSVDVVVARLTRSYGPTLLASDTKALSQFLRNGLRHEDIVLKSEGNQYFSYTYSADAVSGLLTVMFFGETGEAYNIADRKSDIRLKDLAALIAGQAGTKVIFDLPDAVESSGFSKVTKARLDNAKISRLGWQAAYDMEEGIRRTMAVLADTQ